MASSPERLNVIALISGGKDSFFSALHCSLHGHSLVALANLFPAPDAVAGRDGASQPVETQVIHPHEATAETGPNADDTDLNSFMYQTVGHQLIPLYAAATGLPLYRQPIRGGARDEGRDYDAHGPVTTTEADVDETESMVPLLRAVIKDHPEANALCAGAILSTYQRTRVESVALRLGLTPLAYLWKFPVLPPPGPGLPREDAQLLLDMAAAGLDARVIKVASAGLDEDFLWERVSGARGVARIKKALRRFGTAEGSVLGEGGEFETIVVDGPASLFKQRIVVPDGETSVVKEGGGTSWLSIRKARLEDKAGNSEEAEAGSIRVPELLDQRFQAVADALRNEDDAQSQMESAVTRTSLQVPAEVVPRQDLYWTVSRQHSSGVSIEEETRGLVEEIQNLLKDRPNPLPTTAITNTIIILRRMADFPAINTIYARLFKHPNPPSRVTISCGDLLPEGSNIAIHLTVRDDLKPSDRKGLHVQSRSYWAPANIGPYSQSIDVPLFATRQPGQDNDKPTSSAGARVLAIAGQIPLWPATMVIPPEVDVTLQIVLSLQHLWRIGVDQKVQLWSSAVAYFPRASSSEEMRRQGVIAAKAWEQAHRFSTDEEDDDETGPDLWDRTHNPQYMTFGGADAGAGIEGQLPDWGVFRGSSRPVPPFFAVEVEELPRQSGVEWHAHAGLAGLEDASAEVVEHAAPSVAGASVSHTMVADVPVRSIVSLEAVEGQEPKSPGELVDTMSRIYAESTGASGGQARPYLVYLQVAPGTSPVVIGSAATAVVPCRSIWSGRGRPVAALGLFSAMSR
ncbi:hypothetical protein B0T11DRAFT_21584 [Plectosphaerella cucumerina]|uniref:Diphthine--ammonia ligase n=1 Tax=Plectosphaerella cucumerina TaxID=40658 RepID=A0A8K0TTN4_9PEZI|nr:hypothetical protein B0T11DRAFT_21584 [Plectosphaerella cucumerina]